MTSKRVGARMRLNSALLISIVGVAAAHADPVPNGTVAGVSAHAQAAGGPQFNYTDATIVNGVVTQENFNQSTSGTSNGAATIQTGLAPFSPNLSITQNGFTSDGKENATTSTAASDLSTGLIRLSVVPNDSASTGAPSGNASGTIGDTVTFDNTTGSAIDLGLSLAVDGSFSAGAPGVGRHDADVFLQFYTDGGPSATQLVSTTGAHGAVRDFYVQYQYQGGNAPFPFTSFTDNGGGFDSGKLVSLNDTSTSSSIDVVLGATLYVPAGMSSIDIGAKVDTSCDSAFTCDLSHTGALAFATLPSGLTFTSDSGVFLTPRVPGVPEPTTWAMMLLGFAAIGWAAAGRQQRAATT